MARGSSEIGGCLAPIVAILIGGVLGGFVGAFVGLDLGHEDTSSSIKTGFVIGCLAGIVFWVRASRPPE